MTSTPPDPVPVQRLIWILLLALTAALALHPLANNDLPLHLAVGEEIWRQGRIPSEDPFSFTAPAGNWVPHEWLAGLIFAGCESVGGVAGLQLLLLGSSLGLIALHRRLATGLGVTPIVHLGWTVPLLLLLGPRLILRPHLLVLALVLATWILLLEGRRRPRLLLGLPLIMGVWVNLHGSFLLGYGVILLDFVVGDREHRLDRRKRGLLAAGVAATLLLQLQAYGQPHLLAGLLHPFRLLRDPVFMQQIQEWRSPFAADNGEFRRTVPFALSIPWTLLALIGVFSRRGVPFSYRVFVLGTLLLYARHQRFLGLFALASLPLLPEVPGMVIPRLRRFAPAAMAMVATIFFLAFGYPYYWDRPPRRAGWGWERNLPLPEARALEKLGYEGNVVCEYDYGGVLSWVGKGRWRVSMDSRNSVYGAELYILHQKALEVDTWIQSGRIDAGLADVRQAVALRERLLEEAGAVLIRDPAADPRRTGLHRRLEASERWLRISATPGRALLYYKRN